MRKIAESSVNSTRFAESSARIVKIAEILAQNPRDSMNQRRFAESS